MSLKLQNSIENKISRFEYKLAELTDRNKFQNLWHFENPTAEWYRRSMVPFYLLEMESNRYPIYIDNSNLNQNLTTNFKIKQLTIHVTPNVMKELTQDNTISKDSKKILITLYDISLLSTAEKLIKMVEKKIEESSKISFDQMMRLQILKFKGIDSFVYGETQLIYFVEIREHLRSKRQNLELFLVSLTDPTRAASGSIG